MFYFIAPIVIIAGLSFLVYSINQPVSQESKDRIVNNIIKANSPYYQRQVLAHKALNEIVDDILSKMSDEEVKIIFSK